MVFIPEINENGQKGVNTQTKQENYRRIVTGSYLVRFFYSSSLGIISSNHLLITHFCYHHQIDVFTI